MTLDLTWKSVVFWVNGIFDDPRKDYGQSACGNSTRRPPQRALGGVLSSATKQLHAKGV